MIRLLTAVLLLTYAHFGWAMAYPEDYNGVPHDNFKEGDVIDHTKFNQNNLSIKEAINDRVPVPSNCSTNQIIRYDGNGWVCANDVLATLNCDVGDRLIRGDNGWECSNGHSVSGNLTGMDSGNSVGLTLNGVSLTMSANGLFTFPNQVEVGQPYTVQVQAQPSTGTETCEVTANGSGNVLAPITNVAVHCYPSAFARTSDYSVGISTTLYAIFETRSDNLLNEYCSPSQSCVFSLSNASDHTACTLTATNDSSVAYSVAQTKSGNYIVIDNAGAVFGSQSVNVEILCPSL